MRVNVAVRLALLEEVLNCAARAPAALVAGVADGTV
jgi:hypothetical protein